MASRRPLAFVLAAALLSLGASFPSTNFVVEAPTPQIAQQVAQAAEQYRKAKAMEWLGQEMPNWPEPCPLRVKVTIGGAGGATSFTFDRGRVLGQNMNIEGSLDRVLASVLPHEVTHTVFAYYFRCPVPRWADEGGAVLSEDDIERSRHDQLVRQILNSGRAIPLRRLFALRDYPNDVMTLYAEGYSVSQFLVDRSNRQTFLGFVAYGMGPQGWDNAVRAYYRFNSVDELEQAWLTHLRQTRRPAAQLAQNNQTPTGGPTQGTLVRQTIPPAQPLLAAPVPIVRGQAPSPGQENDRFGNPPRPGLPIAPAGAHGVSPGYLPEYNPSEAVSSPPAPHGQPSTQPAPGGWRPAAMPQGPPPPSIRLGPPQFGPAPFTPPGQPAGLPVSPVGYPN